MKRNISILGCGRWGSFIGWYLANQDFKVTQWGLEEHDAFKVLKETGKNEYVELDKRITLTSDLEYAINASEVLIISISSQAVSSFIKDVVKFDVSNKTFVLCMKGIDVTTGERLSEILIDAGIDKNKIAVWVGPGHIQAFTQGQSNCMVIDSYNHELAKSLATEFRSNLIRFYYGNDVIGTEIGAAAKNVMGIAAGMLEGLGLDALKGPLMARGAYEVSQLIEKLGGKMLSAYGLCHLGDYETTLFSKYSNNRRFGEMYVKGEKFQKLAEGVTTALAMKKLGEKLGVRLPITEAVCRIIYDNEEPLEVIAGFFGDVTTGEFVQ